jgi:dTDP-4-amino-4,6-dideoxygalactose transaminase
MPVHCYGNPCDVDAIQQIADDYNLKVIFDAAHAFDFRSRGRSILNHGDLSILSFHATKVFNTFEGGEIIFPDAKTKQRIDHLKNFGFANAVTVVATGISGKMSEINASFGLLQLKHLSHAIERRRAVARLYRERLAHISGITCVEPTGQETANCSYFPILVGPEYPLTRDELYESMKSYGVRGRRYFFPLISSFPMYRGLPSAAPENLPVATQLALRVICLPLYPAMTDEDVDRVVSVIAAPEKCALAS